MKSKKKAVVLLSGGMDSCITAAEAVIKHSEVFFLHFSYRQRTEKRELKAFNEIAKFFSVKNKIILKSDFLKIIGGSSLTDFSKNLGKSRIDGIPDTYVPFRNGIFISIASAFAESVGAEYIYIGAVWEDSSGYPDCRPEFYKAMNKAVNLGTRPSSKIKIITPIINLKKSEIIKKGIRLKAPLHLTWSCYQNSRIACGKCESCKLRLKAFKEAGIIDPIPYKK
ncbi:MAG: 7-cyano-7-deazaguanine synthase QueC [bacterium]|nr:7-cyano-7-deazaguanine synthase QueC [bacterium]